MTITTVLMGIFFKLETIVFIDEVEPEDYTDYDDFIQKTKANYTILAINCWIAAAIYLLMIGISYMCLRRARSLAKKKAQRLQDDEMACNISKQKQK